MIFITHPSTPRDSRHPTLTAVACVAPLVVLCVCIPPLPYVLYVCVPRSKICVLHVLRFVCCVEPLLAIGVEFPSVRISPRTSAAKASALPVVGLTDSAIGEKSVSRLAISACRPAPCSPSIAMSPTHGNHHVFDIAQHADTLNVSRVRPRISRPPWPGRARSRPSGSGHARPTIAYVPPRQRGDEQGSCHRRRKAAPHNSQTHNSRRVTPSRTHRQCPLIGVSSPPPPCPHRTADDCTASTVRASRADSLTAT